MLLNFCAAVLVQPHPTGPHSLILQIVFRELKQQNHYWNVDKLLLLLYYHLL